MDKLLTAEELAELLNISPRTLEHWRYKGDGPPYVKLPRGVRYKHDDVVKWLNSNMVTRHGAGE